LKITVVGTGYVGLVTGACLADAGNQVFCLDVDAAKVDALNRGEIPIFEPGLAPVVERNRKAGRIVFSTDVDASVAHGELQLIAVGTPAIFDGRNLYDPALLRARGFEYFPIGRRQGGDA
jgi:UDPglucose 6-dehydrogenase